MCECGMNCSTLNLQNAYELELLAIDRLKLKRASRFEQATRIWARASASRCEDLKARAAFSVGRESPSKAGNPKDGALRGQG